jgi:hypothetical protein
MAGVALAAWVIFLGVIIVGLRFGRPTTVTLLQYQGGVLYNRGLPVREVSAGRHRVWAGVEKIIVLDKRPITTALENRAVALSDGATAVYGFSATSEIRDVSKVLYSGRNYNEVPAYVLLCCARLVLNTSSSESLIAHQEAISQQISEIAKARLRSAGFDLGSFCFTHLSIAASQLKPSS